jgi:uncharacterized membrane protein YgcG
MTHEHHRTATVRERHRRSDAHSSERGFALLLIFLMAAVVAIFMYMELPRAAFEAERQREERLVDIGKEYRRAIQLYVRETKKFPADLDDLAKQTNNKRFLRHKYIDPMTGKDEWRLIHANQTGAFTDSHIKKKEDKDKEKGPNSFITERAHVGQEALDSAAGGTGAVSPAFRMRPSDRPGAPGQGGAGTGGNSGYQDPNNPNAANSQQFNNPALNSGIPQLPGQNTANPYGQSNTGATQGSTGTPFPGGQFPPGVFPGGVQPGATGASGQAGSTSQTGSTGGITAMPGLGGTGITAQPGIGGVAGGMNSGGQYGYQGGQQSGRGFQYGSGGTYPQATDPNRPYTPASTGGLNDAAKTIMQGLTQPRPGGAPPGVAVGAGGMLLAGGVAGIASKLEAKGVKLFNETDKIGDWEFVYDFQQDMNSRMKVNLGTPGGPDPGYGKKPDSSSSSSSSSGFSFGSGSSGKN